jgi:hypothetical protein
MHQPAASTNAMLPAKMEKRSGPSQSLDEQIPLCGTGEDQFRME